MSNSSQITAIKELGKDLTDLRHDLNVQRQKFENLDYMVRKQIFPIIHERYMS